MMLRKIQDALQISPMHPISTGLCPMGGIKKPIDALLFDVYGTLFISASGDIGLARNRSRKSTQLQKLLKKYQIGIIMMIAATEPTKGPTISAFLNDDQIP